MENATPKKSTIQRLITGLIIGFAALFLLIAGGLPLLMLIAVVVIIGSTQRVLSKLEGNTYCKYNIYSHSIF